MFGVWCIMLGYSEVCLGIFWYAWTTLGIFDILWYVLVCMGYVLVCKGVVLDVAVSFGMLCG